MLILSLKPGHDGAIAAIHDGELLFSLEAEKDSFPRYSPVTPFVFEEAARLLPAVPEVVCQSGWVKGFHSGLKPLDAGYFGESNKLIRTSLGRFMGHDVKKFSSTHERSHLFGSYAMSPFEQGAPCYALVWEGNIGAFYYFDENTSVRKVGNVVQDPGNKYAFLFALADPTCSDATGTLRLEDAGKLMSLAAFSDRGAPSRMEQEVIDFILSRKSISLSTSKADLKETPYYNCGVENNEFKQLAGKFSDALFSRFHDFARQKIQQRLPLLISGGCGLNCEWNTKWVESGLFSQVFVPPCANDSGSAIGTAADASFYYTGNAKLKWSVDAGTSFVSDCQLGWRYEQCKASPAIVADHLLDGRVLGWVTGRYEMGPRALGHRSILASPFDPEMTARLNLIKQREAYRPIAPVCLVEDIHALSGRTEASPYMLHFYKVSTSAIPATTHIDGSARFQTVSAPENPSLYALLTRIKAVTGLGILCNTSLNFKGRGFINRLSDLSAFAHQANLDGFVVEDTLYLRKK